MVKLRWKYKHILYRKRLPGWATAGLFSTISVIAGRPILFWLASAVVMVIIAAGFLIIPLAPKVQADDGTDSSIEDCLSCHGRELQSHDKLGSGNKACWVCHDATDMNMLRLADGTILSRSDSGQLCAQCHQERYQAWKEGTHGIPGTVATVNCTACHDPHKPQIALLNITKPHPGAQPPPYNPSVELQVMLGTVIVLTIGVVIIVATRGTQP